MDGGRKQRQMAEQIKAEIKKSSEYRRERHAAQKSIARSSRHYNQEFTLTVSQNFTNEVPSSISLEHSTDSQHFSSSSQIHGSPSDAFSNQFLPAGLDEIGSILGFLSEKRHTQSNPLTFTDSFDCETELLMKYLDFVFPFLFPFYQPSLFETGRSWILSLLKHSSIALVSILSLTSYFFTVALTDAYRDQHGDCKIQLWARLISQTDVCFDMIQHEINKMNDENSQIKTLDKVRVMESIVQFMLFEVSLGKSANWKLHLTAALALFEEVVQKDKQGTPDINFLDVLDGIDRPAWFSGMEDCYIWSPEQAGFRFFAALLVFIDVISSTSIQKPPRLMKYHP